MRLPFGPKNSKAIRRGDVLRKYIERCCCVYVDDIVAFSKMEDDQFTHIGNIFKTLQKASMTI